jgi:hypothetical protein
MCDYSLEAFQSRPARMGEEYVSNRFPSGSVGFVAPGDQSVAICMACDMELELSHERGPEASWSNRERKGDIHPGGRTSPP